MLVNTSADYYTFVRYLKNIEGFKETKDGWKIKEGPDTEEKTL